MYIFHFLLQLAFLFNGESGDDKYHPVQEVIKFDTILNTGVVCDFSIPGEPVSAIHHNELWMYTPSQLTTDTIQFININLIDKSVTLIHSVFPNNPHFPELTIATAIAVSDKYCAVLFLRQVLLFSRNSDTTLVFQDSISFTGAYGYIGVQGDTLYLGRCYNQHPNEGPTTEILQYDMMLKRVKRIVHPDFDIIEFTHFAPNNWIDFCADKSLFAQTGKYSIAVLDRNLNIINQITRVPQHWNAIDANRISGVRNSNIAKARQLKRMIGLLEPIDDEFSRVEAANYIDDTTIIVRYTPSNNRSRGRLRQYDVWRLRDNQWELLRGDLVETNRPNGKDVAVRENYPLFGAERKLVFYGKFCISVKPFVDVNPLGVEYASLQQRIDSLMSKSMPAYHVFLYSIALDDFK